MLWLCEHSNYYSFQLWKKGRKHSIWPYFERACEHPSLYNVFPIAWNTDPELLQSIGSKVICFAEQDTWAKQLTAFTWKQKVKHIPTCLHKHRRSAHTCTDKHIDAYATILFYQKQTRVLCIHLTLWLVLSDCLSEQNERASGSIETQGWWMKGMKDRQEKGRKRRGQQKKEEETEEHLALVAKSKSDNRMTKLSGDGMLS